MTIPEHLYSSRNALPRGNPVSDTRNTTASTTANNFHPVAPIELGAPVGRHWQVSDIRTPAQSPSASLSDFRFSVLQNQTGHGNTQAVANTIARYFDDRHIDLRYGAGDPREARAYFDTGDADMYYFMDYGSAEPWLQDRSPVRVRTQIQLLANPDNDAETIVNFEHSGAHTDNRMHFMNIRNQLEENNFIVQTPAAAPTPMAADTAPSALVSVLKTALKAISSERLTTANWIAAQQTIERAVSTLGAQDTVAESLALNLLSDEQLTQQLSLLIDLPTDATTAQPAEQHQLCAKLAARLVASAVTALSPMLYETETLKITLEPVLQSAQHEDDRRVAQAVVSFHPGGLSGFIERNNPQLRSLITGIVARLANLQIDINNRHTASDLGIALRALTAHPDPQYLTQSLDAQQLHRALNNYMAIINLGMNEHLPQPQWLTSLRH